MLRRVHPFQAIVLTAMDSEIIAGEDGGGALDNAVTDSSPLNDQHWAFTFFRRYAQRNAGRRSEQKIENRKRPCGSQHLNHSMVILSPSAQYTTANAREGLLRRARRFSNPDRRPAQWRH